MSTLIMWHNRFSENENEAVEAHIPRHRDSKTKKPRHRETETVNPSWFQEIFSEDKKPWHQDSKAEKPRHRDSQTKQLRHRVPVEFWPLCPLIIYQGGGWGPYRVHQSNYFAWFEFYIGNGYFWTGDLRNFVLTFPSPPPMKRL